MGAVISVCAEERKVEDRAEQSKKEKNEAQGSEALQKDKKNFKEVKININLSFSSEENSASKLSDNFFTKMEQLEKDSNSQDSDSEYKVLNKKPSGNSQKSQKSNKKKQKQKKQKQKKKITTEKNQEQSSQSQNYSQNEYFESVQENKKQVQTKELYQENSQFGQEFQEKKYEVYPQQIDFETVLQNQINPQSNSMQYENALQNEQVDFSNQYQQENIFKLQAEQVQEVSQEAESKQNKQEQQQQFQNQQNLSQDLNNNSNIQQQQDNSNHSQLQQDSSKEQSFYEDKVENEDKDKDKDEDEVSNQSQKLSQREIGYQKQQDQIIILGIEQQDNNKMKKHKQAQMLEQNFAPAIQYEYSEDKQEKKLQQQTKQFKSESNNSKDVFENQQSTQFYTKGKTEEYENRQFNMKHERHTYAYNKQQSSNLPQRNTYVSPLDMDAVKKQIIQSNLQHNIMGELHNQVYDTVTPLLEAENQIELGDVNLFYRPSLDVENLEETQQAVKEKEVESAQLGEALIEDQQNQLKQKREQFEQMFKSYDSKVQSFLESKSLKIDLQKDWELEKKINELKKYNQQIQAIQNNLIEPQQSWFLNQQPQGSEKPDLNVQNLDYSSSDNDELDSPIVQVKHENIYSKIQELKLQKIEIQEDEVKQDIPFQQL